MAKPPEDPAQERKAKKTSADPSPLEEANDGPQVQQVQQSAPRYKIDFEDVSDLVESLEEGWEQHTDPLASGSSSTPRLSSDVDHGDDCLGVRSEAQAFARIICSRQTATPLSIGLFGDWGSGKSFFMDLLRGEIRARGKALADAGERKTQLETRWHSHIAQIEFNAWHYAEPNLWASLVTRIFDALAEDISDNGKKGESIEQARARLLAEVSEGKQRRDQAQMELQIAAEQLAAALDEREEREAALEQIREELAVVEAIAPPKGPPAEPASAADAEDAEPASAAATSAVAEKKPPSLKVDGVFSKLRVTWRWIWSRGRGARIAVVAAAVVLLLAAVFAFAWWREHPGTVALVAVVGPLLTTLGATLATWAKAIAPKLEAAMKAHQAVVAGKTATEGFLSRAVGDLLRPGQDAARLARQRFEAARIELESAATAAEQASEDIARARRTLQQLDGGHRFYDFISERDESDDYRRHLGLVSLIREDFDNLEKILDQIEREGAGEDAPAPISRIVLYIDDLDRCEPERVVEVLQAVHLLLATPIFVVVVAVDVRWLRRSLTLHYDRLLQTASEGTADPADQARPTPKNYLEKIFQIPFSLRPMDAAGFSSFVGDLLRDDLEASSSPSESPSDDSSPASASLERPPETALEPSLLDDTVLTLEPREVAFMQTLHRVIDTPRLAKALVNTYRLLRAELSEAELGPYLAEERYRGVLILLAIQVGRSAEATVLFDELEQSGPGTLQQLVAHLAKEREPKARWQSLYAALHELDPEDRITHRLRPWIARIRRFSFNPWPTG